MSGYSDIVSAPRRHSEPRLRMKLRWVELGLSAPKLEQDQLQTFNNFHSCAAVHWASIRAHLLPSTLSPFVLRLQILQGNASSGSTNWLHLLTWSGSSTLWACTVCWTVCCMLCTSVCQYGRDIRRRRQRNSLTLHPCLPSLWVTILLYSWICHLPRFN